MSIEPPRTLQPAASPSPNRPVTKRLIPRARVSSSGRADLEEEKGRLKGSSAGKAVFEDERGTGRAVFEDEKGRPHPSFRASRLLIPGLTRNLPKPELQKRRPMRFGATCAPSRRGMLHPEAYKGDSATEVSSIEISPDQDVSIELFPESPQRQFFFVSLIRIDHPLWKKPTISSQPSRQSWLSMRS